MSLTKEEIIEIEKCISSYPDYNFSNENKSTASQCEDDDESKDHLDFFLSNMEEYYYPFQTYENIIIIEEEQKNINILPCINKECVKTKKINKYKYLSSINRKIFKNIGKETSPNSFIKKEIKEIQKNIEYPKQWELFVNESNFKKWISENDIQKSLSSFSFLEKFWDYVNDDSLSWKIKHFKAVLANYILYFIENDAKNWVKTSKKIKKIKNSENYELCFEILKSEILKKI